jgi:hypothetical protein
MIPMSRFTNAQRRVIKRAFSDKPAIRVVRGRDVTVARSLERLGVLVLNRKYLRYAQAEEWSVSAISQALVNSNDEIIGLR